MATVGLYGSSSSGVVAAASGSESTGLYGNNVNFGGSYFEWFIFQQSDLQPATPTGGSWSFSTNTGVAPTGWSSVPPSNPTNKIWVSIALVNSKNASPLEWSVPGLFSYASGLPILSANGAPGPGDGQSDQLYIQLDTTPQTIWFKESGTWTRLTGSTLYVDLTSNQTIAGTKTFSSQIQGSVSGTAGNVTGVVGIANGGTGSTTASAARTALGAAASGANSDITSMSGLTGGISTPDNIQFDTTATATVAKGNLRWNTTTNTLSFGIIDGTDEVNIGEQMFAYVTNADSVTITRGQPVYLFAATGNRASVKLASNLGDSTSAKTLGLAAESIAPNAAGFVITQGVLDKLNTNGFAEGATLYLGATAGTLTSTKPQAPNHLVYIGVVERSNAGNGQIYVKPQNGYEIGELHDVKITTPVADNSFLVYDTGLEVWQNEAPATARTSLGLGSAAVLNAGVANGVATLDAGGTVPLSQIPASIQGGVSYQGTWNASTNTPILTSGVGTKGYYYVVSVAGNTNLNGVTAWNIGDWAIFNGTAWEKVDNTDAVTSVNGYTGTVVLTNTDISGFGTMSTQNANSVAITGGAINGTAIGGSTAAAGSFTTLTTSGAVTHNAGTANGVAYLNGSKVLTTGSALTFDGTNLGFGGNLNSTLTSEFYLQSPAGSNFIGINQASGYVRVAAGNAEVLRLSNTAAIFALSSLEQMRLTSTGLGIGTSSPAAKLQLGGYAGTVALRMSRASTDVLDFYQGAGVSYIDSSAAGGQLAFATVGTERMRLDSSGNFLIGGTTANGRLDVAVPDGTTNAMFLERTGASPASLAVTFANQFSNLISSGVMTFAVNGSERARIDSSGNVGIGTSGTTNGRLNVLAGTAATGNSLFLQNSDGTINPYLQVQHSSAGVRLVVGNSFSGANNNLIFGSTNTLNGMTLNDSGNLGLGVTPNSTWRSGHSVIQLGGGTGMSLASGTGTGYGLFQNYYLDNAGPKYANNGFASAYYQFNGAHVWFTAPSGTAGNAISFTQAMTLDASGNLGIGATSVVGALHIAKNDAQLHLEDPRTTGDGSHTVSIAAFKSGTGYNNLDFDVARYVFKVSGTERARITSGGDLLVGTTSAFGSGRMGLVFDQNNNRGITVQNTSSTNTGTFLNFYNSSGGSQGFISQTNSTTTVYSTSSDYRLKEDIAPMTGALAKVAALKPVTYKWKADGSDGEGFIAHELAEVVPQCVVGEKDAVDADGNPVYQGIDTSFLVATLTAALQEAHGLIKDLQSRVAALEAK